MEQQGILVASFGTSHDSARERGVDALVEWVRTANPAAVIRQAYTSGMVRAILARRGIVIPSVEQALDELRTRGIRRLAVLPTHILAGEEYDKLTRALGARADLFEAVGIGTPLLGGAQDMAEVADVLAKRYACEDGEALVLVGHGTKAGVNAVFADLEALFRERGHACVFIGTIEADPDRETTVQRVAASGCRRAVLAPLLLAAGDHAAGDILGDGEDSWKSALEARGIAVTPMPVGLGEIEGIREIYMRHLRETIGYAI